MGTLKRVLVTGAEGALGGHVVRRFASAGVAVVATYFKARPPESASQVSWIQADLSNTASVSDLALEAIDGWVHCAGGFRWALIDGSKDEDFDFLLNSNLRSSFVVARKVLPGMKSRGFGRIVMIGSRAALTPGKGMGLYAASKAGVHAFVAALSDEVKDLDINVNAVLPTTIDTPANRHDMPAADFSAWVAPADLAETIFSLTQPGSKAIRGALIPVPGKL